MKIQKIGNKIGYRRNRNILIEKYKSIYFFMPKNGCTSFKKAVFEHISGTKHEGAIHKHDFPNVDFEQLNTDYNHYMKFALVRNPWNRLASCFKGKIRSADFNSKNYKNGVARILQRYDGLFYGGMPFDEFVDVVCAIPFSLANPHFLSQLYWFTNYSGELLPNYFGRLEHLEPTIEDIFKHTGLSFTNVEHENKSRVSTSYTEFYNDDLKDKVAKKFAGDIEMFGYKFEPDPHINHIGFIDDAFHERWAKSENLDLILQEKDNELKLIRDGIK